MDRTWRVVFAGPASDDELDRLRQGQMLYVSGHALAGLRSATIWVRAGSAAAAEEAVRDAISAPGTVLPAAPLPYTAWIGVDEEDAGQVARALSARRRATGEIGGLIDEEATDGYAELIVDVPADTDDEALEQAREYYRALRNEAGLAPAEPTYLRVQPPWSGEEKPAKHDALLTRANNLLDRGLPDMAVVVAQIGFEVLVRRVINERLQAREIGGLRAHIMRYQASLNNPQSQGLWEELTGDRIGIADGWSDYMTHLKHRNAVVHDGTEVSPADGSVSLAAVRAMFEHIALLPPPGGLGP